jgi:hypothetical protein
MFGIINKKVAISNFKLARPRYWPSCPAGHGPLIPKTTAWDCLDCEHEQPRNPTNRIATATDLSWHLRQADAEEPQNEKRTIGPAGDSGGRGRAIPGGEDNTSADKIDDAKIDQWVRESIEAEREAYRNRNWY